MNLKLIRSAGALILLATSALAHPAAFPQKPLTIIVPFPPGGSSDMTARIMAPKMSEKLGQPVVSAA